MLKVIITLFVLCAVLTLSVLGFQLWQGANMSSDAFALSQEVQTLKIKKELAEIKRDTQQDAIKYRLTAAKLAAKEKLARSSVVGAAREVGAATLYAWPIFVLLGGVLGAGLFAYSRRQAVVCEIEKARNTLLMQEESAALKLLERAAPAIARSVAAALPKQAAIMPETVPVEPEMLPAFTGNVFFSQTKLDPDYDDRLIMWGRDVEAGGVRQQSLEDVESLCINGLQRFGKSTLLQTIIHNSLLRQYVYNENVRTILIDLHAGAPKDSLSKDLETFCPGILTLFHKTFLGEEEIVTGLVSYFDDLFAQFQPGKQPAQEELVIIFDEYTETISNTSAGADLEDRVKRLFNRRKYGVRLILAMFESTKNRNSAAGLNVSKMSVSRSLFKMDAEAGKRFMKGAEGCQTLKKGEYLLQTPGDIDASRIQAPIFSAMDFQQFTQYTVQNPTQAPESEPEAIDLGVSAESIRSYISGRKQHEPKFSQNAVAKEAGLSSKNMSYFLNGKRPLKPDEEQRMLELLHAGIGGAVRKVVNIEKYRTP